MDALSIAGLVLGLSAIIIGNGIEGGSFGELINGPAFIIVMGGTVGATLLQSRSTEFRQAFSLLPWVVKPPLHDVQYIISRVVSWSEVARREGLLGLENVAEREADGLAKHGLWLLVDGYDTHQIRHILGYELVAMENDGLKAAKVFEAMGGYAPTIGIIGAVLGLIQVMYNLTDPALLGPGIATAFVATIYGVGLANLVLIPIAEKIKTIVIDQSVRHDVLIEGLVALAEGDNPRMIESRLSGFASTSTS